MKVLGDNIRDGSFEGQRINKEAEPGEARSKHAHESTLLYMAPFVTILVSLERSRSQLSNETNIITNGAIYGRFVVMFFRQIIDIVYKIVILWVYGSKMYKFYLSLNWHFFVESVNFVLWCIPGVGSIQKIDQMIAPR